MSEITFANPDVLEFYRQLPFNYHGSAASQANMVRTQNSVSAYPVLFPILKDKPRILEVGCGAGWLTLSFSLHHGCPVSAIDFNPVVIERAKEMARLLRQPVEFEVADLFKFVPKQQADLVVSIGVLHHTDNCIAAIERCCTEFVRLGGRVFIGLYHAHGRRPFLDHFETMKRKGESEDAMFAEYRRLHSQLKDETFARSWFRDQVLHPHETQHTMREMAPLLDRCGMELESSSVNGFKSFAAPEELFAAEEVLKTAGERALAAGEYYPGFFVFLARRKAA